MSQILIAEDEVRIAAFIEKGLQRHGYSTVVAKDGIEAIEMLREDKFDLLLLDLGLPGKDGWVVLQELRTQISPDLDVIIVTARDDVADRVKGGQFGVQGHIIKPFKFNDLLERVKLRLNMKD
ncbi:MAG: response regulator transcription factor [Cyanobacteria bacterium CRU_2_1]|nr:response regulator transcription factor [Cyanobacteria bacterium CRU_2_1]